MEPNEPVSNPRVTHVEARSDARLFIRYSDGLEGVVDLGRAIGSNEGLARLRDPEFFAKVAVVDGGVAIGWPDDIAIDGFAQRSRIASENAKELTPEQLEQAGAALFGRNWKTELAEDLGISDSSRIRAMMRGDRPIPIGFSREIAALLRQRRSDIDAALTELS